MSETIAEECCFGPEVLRTLLTQLPVGVLMTDRQGRLVYANAAAHKRSESLEPLIESLARL